MMGSAEAPARGPRPANAARRANSRRHGLTVTVQADEVLAQEVKDLGVPELGDQRRARCIRTRPRLAPTARLASVSPPR